MQDHALSCFRKEPFAQVPTLASPFFFWQACNMTARDGVGSAQIAFSCASVPTPETLPLQQFIHQLHSGHEPPGSPRATPSAGLSQRKQGSGTSDRSWGRPWAAMPQCLSVSIVSASPRRTRTTGSAGFPCGSPFRFDQCFHSWHYLQSLLIV